MLSLLTVIALILKVRGVVDIGWFWVFFPTILEVLYLIGSLMFIKYYV